MSILTEDEYREIFETVEEYSETVSSLIEERREIDRDNRPSDIEELNDAGAVFYRSNDNNNWYVVASSLGEEALDHQAHGGSMDQYLTAMMWKEEVLEEIYS